MAKKKTKKRHIAKRSANKISQVQPTNPEDSHQEAAATVVVTTAAARMPDRSDYARQDVRQIGLLAASFIALLCLAWAVFNYTGVGQSVYGLIKL